MIGVTEENNQIISQTLEQGLFNTEADFGRFAYAYALMRELDLRPTKDISGKTTKWAIDSIDRDGVLKNISLALHPEVEDPYDFIEYAINLGIEAIGEEMVMGKINSIVELIKCGELV